MFDSPEYTALWRDYHSTRSIALRNRLALKHRGIAQKMARRASIDALEEQHQDLEQIAYLGLIRAVERFDYGMVDPSRGCIYKMFGAFAGGFCRGAILHWLRDNSAIKIPRGWRDFNSQIRKAKRNGANTFDQIAAVTGETADRIEEIERALVCLHPVKLDFADPDLEVEFEAKDRAEYRCDDLEHHWQTVIERLNTLPSTERSAISLLFCQRQPKKTVARQLRLQSWQVDSLVSIAFERLSGTYQEVPVSDCELPAIGCSRYEVAEQLSLFG